MGASYFIIPLKTFGASPEDVAAMTRLGVTPMDWQGAGRFPSLTELQSRLAVLVGYKVGSPGFWNRRSWQISVESVTEPDCEYAVLDCLEYGGNPDQSYAIGFYRGSPRTMILVTRCLTEYLGAAVLLCEYGEAVLVRSDTSPDAEWVQLPEDGDGGDSAA